MLSFIWADCFSLVKQPQTWHKRGSQSKHFFLILSYIFVALPSPWTEIYSPTFQYSWGLWERKVIFSDAEFLWAETIRRKDLGSTPMNKRRHKAYIYFETERKPHNMHDDLGVTRTTHLTWLFSSASSQHCQDKYKPLGKTAFLHYWMVSRNCCWFCLLTQPYIANQDHPHQRSRSL